MIQIMKTREILRIIFTEPTTNKYVLDDDIAVKLDVSWISHKEDAKNLAKDYQSIKKDFRVAVSEYRKLRNGKATD
jgi:Mn-dependent DtxR family transcriptional regulator